MALLTWCRTLFCYDSEYNELSSCLIADLAENVFLLARASWLKDPSGPSLFEETLLRLAVDMGATKNSLWSPGGGGGVDLDSWRAFLGSPLCLIGLSQLRGVHSGNQNQQEQAVCNLPADPRLLHRALKFVETFVLGVFLFQSEEFSINTHDAQDQEARVYARLSEKTETWGQHNLAGSRLSDLCDYHQAVRTAINKCRHDLSEKN